MFRHEISDGNTWTRNTSFDYGGTQTSPIGRTAKAFDDRSDDGKGVLWFYGGGYWQDPVKVGMETKGAKLELVEFEDLWRMPGDCDTKNVVACKLDTKTSGTSTAPRGYLQGTMVWVDNGSKGWLVLFGGTFRGDLVRTCSFCCISPEKKQPCLRLGLYGMYHVNVGRHHPDPRALTSDHGPRKLLSIMGNVMW